MKKKAFVGIKAAYHKYEAALAVLDHSHASRSGFTRSQNVHSEQSHRNIGYYYHGAASCTEALDLLCDVLFEHVVWLSEYQYFALEQRYGHEKVRDAFLARLKFYASSVRREFGFEPLGIDLHFDEGHYCHDQQRFVRNIHGHVQFFNYNFEKRVAPLRHLMNNGKDQNGRTHALNPNFVRLQDLVAEPFKSIGFERGESKLVTGREHQTKEQFVLSKLKATEQANKALELERNRLAEQLLQQRTEQKQLEEQITEQRQEAATLTSELKKLRAQVKQLQELITNKALNAIKQFAARFSESGTIRKQMR
jgi:hypothetical protein